jgi:hypothetical protein
MNSGILENMKIPKICIKLWIFRILVFADHTKTLG